MSLFLIAKNTVGWFQEQKVKFGLHRYDVIAKSTLANLLLQENLNSDLPYEYFSEFLENVCYFPGIWKK